jgi:hypothetical protein
MVNRTTADPIREYPRVTLSGVPGLTRPEAKVKLSTNRTSVLPRT